MAEKTVEIQCLRCGETFKVPIPEKQENKPEFGYCRKCLDEKKDGFWRY